MLALIIYGIVIIAVIISNLIVAAHGLTISEPFNSPALQLFLAGCGCWFVGMFAENDKVCACFDCHPWTYGGILLFLSAGVAFALQFIRQGGFG